MGLFISRQSLRKDGWDITLESTGSSTPPVFRIARNDEAETIAAETNEDDFGEEESE